MKQPSGESPSSRPPLPPLGEVIDFLRLIWRLDHALQQASKRMQSSLGVTGPQRLVIRIVGRFPGLTAGQLAEILHVELRIGAGNLDTRRPKQRANRGAHGLVARTRARRLCRKGRTRTRPAQHC